MSWKNFVKWKKPKIQKTCYFADPLPHPFLRAPATLNTAMYYCKAALSGDAVRFRLASSVRAIPKMTEKNPHFLPLPTFFWKFSFSYSYLKFL